MEQDNQLKFVFVSNYLNHHQIPFCRAMYERTGGSFAFLQTEPMEEERVRMGWNDEVKEPYLKLFYESPKECADMVMNASIVLFGGTDEESYIQERLRSGKVVFRYSERLYKTGQWKAISPRGLRKKYIDHGQYRKSPVYLLCSGAYVPSDFSIIRAYPKKMYCWGYFPEFHPYDVEELLAGKGYQTEDGGKIPYLVWSGRMIDWKHPELVIMTAKHLKEKGIRFHLDMIGGGAMEAEIKEKIRALGLEDVISLPGFMKPQEVRERMERADIYLITSDRQEGWGAVANEAMNSGCAVVADHMIGAAPYLIRQNENGMMYQDGDTEMLFGMVEELVKDAGKRASLGRKAYETIRDTWNADAAAERLCGLIEDLTGVTLEDEKASEQRRARKGKATGREKEFVPCMPAPVIPERGAYKRLTQG
ncbi:MAG: glycosyltransferase [Lachnospiraceae bacterium]|nr:glycosyltransferase [Lachnospiraceae bacterium]